MDAITRSGPFIYIEWTRPGERRKRPPIQYFADQTFDMADRPQQEEAPNMAQRVNILVESDLSGEPEAETLTFGLDGTDYEIDLTADEQAEFRSIVAAYVGVARPVKGGRKNGKARQSGPSAKVIREWAQENGMDVPDRGRIPAEVREAYTAAH